MRRVLGALLIVGLLVTACGDPAGGGGGGGGDFPAGSTVIFGASYDPVGLGVTGRTSSIKQGTPVVAVGKAFTPRPPAEIVVQVSQGSSVRPPRPVSAANNAESANLYAFDLSGDNLTPGTWVVSFNVATTGKVVASGFLVVQP